jgi:hypothetical protein
MAEDGIIDVVPASSHEDGCRGDAWGKAHHIGHENQEVGPDYGGSQAKPGVADSVQQLGAAR